jgi:hypothetical protein
MRSILSSSLLAALTLCLAPNVHANGCNNQPPQCPPHNPSPCPPHDPPHCPPHEPPHCPPHEPPHCPQPPSLSCDAGGPYNVDGQPGVVSVQLDGTDSAGATSWHWSVNYPGAFFDDANVPNPILTIPVTCDCSFNLTVNLTVRRDQQTRNCCAIVRLRDHVPPVITCPDDAKVTCGDDISPEALGFATATDNCDQHVHVTYHDHNVPAACDAQRFDHTIERTWRAVDNDCNSSTCVQTIDVVKQVADLDVLPGVCPNTYNKNSNALLPVAILGNFAFDVTRIQWNSVRLYGLDCNGGPVSAQSYQLCDVGTPFVGSGCGCHDLNGDGRLDLVARFNRSQLNNSLHLNSLPSGTAVQVIVVGRLCDGCKFIAQDCLVIQ